MVEVNGVMSRGSVAVEGRSISDKGCPGKVPLHCLQVLAVVNGAAVNNGVRVLFLNYGFSGYMTSNRVAGS